jgi:tetratricopeptide (TPR) repeat protein
MVLVVLQKHPTDSSRPYVAARCARLAVREDDPNSAMAALREVCTLSCDSTWPINTAVEDCRGAGWGADVDAVLRDVLENKPQFHPDTLFVWLSGPDGKTAELELRLRMINRVIRVHPLEVRSYEVMAELLTAAQRYEEAITICKPAIFGDDLPLILQGRSAWIMAQRGNLDAAIARMREILRTNSDYYWGWQQIANWHQANGAHADYLASAENLVRLAPKDSAAYGYRGEAKLLVGDRKGAKKDFQKALDIDPKYGFAGLHLLDEQLADGELALTARTIARLQENIGGPFVALRAVRLAVRQKDQTKARKQFREMCIHNESTYLLLEKAADAITEAGWSAVVEEVLSEVAKDKNAVSFVDQLWQERKAKKNVPKT